LPFNEKMKELDRELNIILVDTFRSILKVEEAALKRKELADLSINEMHLLEAIGKSPEGRTISDIAGS
jgi:ribosomal protein L20